MPQSLSDQPGRPPPFGKDGPGRSKSSARGTALIGAADDYDPASDTCIEAFALDLAALAADAQQTAA